MNELKIDNEFKELIQGLEIDEREILKKNIRKEGCRDPIVLWNDVILDGHNRYAICTEYELEYKTVNVELANRNEAINWIIDNQLGRRNLPRSVKTYLVGRRYTNEKQTYGGDRKSEDFKEESSGQNDHLINEQKTAEKIADQNKITERTVRRNEEFSNSVDTLAEASGETPMDIIAKTKHTQEDVIKTATLAPEIQKEIVEKVVTGKAKSFKAALKPIVEEEKAQKLKEHLAEHPDTDYCVYRPFTPTKSQIHVCPCGCGYGFCCNDDKWYTATEIEELE